MITPNDEYEYNLPSWTQIRDCISGAKKIKSKGTLYLPKPNLEDRSDDNTRRYATYLKRAIFTNFTAPTIEGMLGLVFRKEPVVEVPELMSELLLNIDGCGTSFPIFLKQLVGESLITGRSGVLTDYSADINSSVLKFYAAEDIIVWHEEVVLGVKRLSTVVLAESKSELNSDFKTEKSIQYRILTLRDNAYVQLVVDEDLNLISETEIKLFNGESWGEIPFRFIGSIDNSTSINKPPLYDISEVNLGHYRNSADYEESSFFVGQPTAVISGLTQSWIDTNMKQGLHLGSRAAILLPENGNASLLQAGSNQMPLEGMKLKESQLVKLGARLIMETTGDDTVDAVKMRYAGQNSKVGAVISNVESGILDCLNWAAKFMISAHNPDDIELEINREFYDRSSDPQMIMTAIQLMDRGVIPKDSIRDNLRRSGFIDSSVSNSDLDELSENLL